MRVLGAVLYWARVCCFSSAHQVWTIAPQDGSIGVLRRGQSGDGLGSARGSALRGGCGCHWQALKEASHYACIYFICTINRELELFGVKYSPSLPLNKISASLCPMPIKGDVFVLLDVITYHPSFLKLNPMLFSFYFLLFFPLWFLCCCCFISNFGLSLSLFTEISSSLYLEKVKHQIVFLRKKCPNILVLEIKMQNGSLRLSCRTCLCLIVTTQPQWPEKRHFWLFLIFYFIQLFRQHEERK